jgi:hypothetical protein
VKDVTDLELVVGHGVAANFAEPVSEVLPELCSFGFVVSLLEREPVGDDQPFPLADVGGISSSASSWSPTRVTLFPV